MTRLFSKTFYINITTNKEATENTSERWEGERGCGITLRYEAEFFKQNQATNEPLPN